jgi:hypothetical protein
VKTRLTLLSVSVALFAAWAGKFSFFLSSWPDGH